MWGRAGYGKHARVRANSKHVLARANLFIYIDSVSVIGAEPQTPGRDCLIYFISKCTGG